MSRLLNFKWWFQDRNTGKIVIIQPPNNTLLAAVVFSALFVAFDAIGSNDFIRRGILAIAFILWTIWAGAEIVNGVNPFRRVLSATTWICIVALILSVPNL